MIKQIDYIWEFAFQEKQVRFKQAELFSPYFEISEIVEDGTNEITVFYNSLCRYAEVFATLLEIEAGAEWKNLLVDIGTHILIEQEIQNGCNNKEIHISRIMKQLENGIYGADIRTRYSLLDKMQKYRLACFMVEQSQCGASVTMYTKALIALWETGVVYKSTDMHSTLLVYAGERKSREKENILKLVEDIFLPIGYEVRVFWDTHFGIVGRPVSLKYDQIELL